jgi:Flp pilus assembly pilin Flp
MKGVDLDAAALSVKLVSKGNFLFAGIKTAFMPMKTALTMSGQEPL